MKRPIAKQRSPRTVAPEIAYLDDMRRHRQKPGSFDELSDMAIQMYEAEADLYVAHDTHPDIMDEYDEHDKGEDKLCLEAIALAGGSSNIVDLRRSSRSKILSFLSRTMRLCAYKNLLSEKHFSPVQTRSLRLNLTGHTIRCLISAEKTSR